MTVKLISPKDVSSIKAALIPEFVIDSWNQIIAKNWNPNSKKSHVLQNEIIELILTNSDREISRNDIFSNHWLDIEGIYREQGWKVVFDKPGYNESYEASFEFSIKS